MRCFIAIPLPDDLKNKIYNILMDIETSGKKVEKENLHITIKFIGEIDENEFEKWKEFMNSLNLKKINITVKGAGTFGTPPRVVFLNVDGDFSEIKSVFKEKDFHPHITFLRYKKYNDGVKNEIMKIKEMFNFSYKFTAEKILFYESILKNSGPVYIEKIERCLI